MATNSREALISAAKMYRVAGKLYTWLPYVFARNGYAFPPRHYYFEVTRRCNLRCAMCQYVNWLRDTPVPVQREGELTTAEWLDVIDQVQRLSLVTFTGGEPFVRDDFMELLERASARCRTHLISNAVLLTAERARRCLDLAPRRAGGLGFNFMGVSIEGPPDVHDAIRGMRGAYERSIAGIKAVTALRDSARKACPMVHVTTVIQAANVDTLARMPEIVASAGGNVLNFTLEVRNWEIEGIGSVDPATFKPSDMVYPRIDSQRLLKALRDTREAAVRAGIEVRMPDMPDDVIAKYYDGEMRLETFRCNSLWTNIIVGAKGDVFPCWLTRAGNVRESSLKELWNGPAMQAFRRKTRAHLYPPCAGCCFLSYRG